MRPENLFVTEEGVLKLGSFGLATQADYYSIKKMEWDGSNSFAPEVLNRKYDMKSDIWSFGILLLKMIGITPYAHSFGKIANAIRDDDLPFKNRDIESNELINFLEKCFIKDVNARWNVNELMHVSDWDSE